ncbi:glycerate kinase [Enterococcus sp. BWB1-3]|uniref:glycerate kinase family protein n=1 Tax=unclassified Enterococcus TaxID=2608891 RepID=UPI001923C516|nr:MULTISPECIES: glycerate kinase [unclassified Enterococcus]MBL1229559.1 glycerate kinase [Enterococcus sp. BWB1-3]MCB5950751.1 glycerate kinase [Enterococcus sp. BWT-B8]MCB5955990.1 glycerate kinase [Enterococcus sp. CWB-B31]
MKIVAAIDSFKGSASSKELNTAFFKNITNTTIEKVNFPIADGGEGTMEAIHSSLGGIYHQAKVQDPLGKLRKINFLVVDIDGVPTAVVESAEVIGIHLVSQNNETLRQSSTYGLGKLLSILIDKGIKHIYVTLGGSGTSDGGLGLLAGLGAEMNFEWGSNPLITAKEVNLTPALSKVKNIKISTLVDVDNPYCGERGFSRVFGPQKGGDMNTLDEFDKKAHDLSVLFKQKSSIDLSILSGAGAAGGLGGALALLGAELVPGFATISQLIGFEKTILDADLVITGEGKIDGQTGGGKVPLGVAQAAKKIGLPVIAICGSRTPEIGALEELTLGIFSIQQGPISLEEAINKKRTLNNVSILGRSLLEIWCRY